MRKLQIYDTPTRDDEPPILLRLRKNKHDDSIDLVTTRPDGKTQWFIIKITGDGKLKRHCSIPWEAGLDLDDEHRIKLKGE